MTIFDSIKYTISDPVTTEELDAMPIFMWADWIESKARKDLYNYDSKKFDDLYSKALRKFILEYEGDNI